MRIPDFGESKDVAIVEITVKPGDRTNADDTIMMPESDKARMDMPAPFAGAVAELLVAEGDRVSTGTPVLRVDAGPRRLRQPPRMRRDADRSLKGG